MSNPLEKKDEIFGYKTLYREIGYYISRLEQYERALKFFDEALRKTPNDKRALKGRAWARLKFCQYEGALDDLRQALELDPDDLVLLAIKSLNIYLDCEFEDGLVQNNRLMPIRKKPENFVVGAMHCSDAIENCLGERAGRPLRDHFLIIRKLAWKKNFEAQKPYEPKSRFRKKKKKAKAHNEPVAPVTISRNLASQRHSNMTNTGVSSPDEEEGLVEEELSTMDTTQIQEDDQSYLGSIHDTIYSQKSEEMIVPPAIKFEHRPLQKYTTNIENFMAEKYLDTLYRDKIFLKELNKLPGVLCPNTKGSEKILQLAKSSFKYVSYKQELLRTRRPFYFIKYQECTLTGALKERIQRELYRQQKICLREAENIMSKLKTAVLERNMRSVLEQAEKLKVYCDIRSKKILPERETIMLVVYDSVCQAFFDLKRLNQNQYAFEQDKRIEMMLGVEISREPSNDSVVGQFKHVYVDYKKQIGVFSERLRKSTCSQEMAWLYHELSRFHCELKQYEISRVYARKCISEGEKLRDYRWIINGTMVILKVTILQQNKNDAKIEARKSVHIARQNKDYKLEEFLQRTVEVISKIEFDDICGPKVLEKREQKILEMMSGKIKDEAAHLIRTMQAIPASRRMSVMPGVKQANDLKTAASKRMSIMPTVRTADADTEIKSSKVDPKGVGFMQMVQYHIDD